MNKSYKKAGIWTNILLTVWIFHTLLGVGVLKEAYHAIGIDQGMIWVATNIVLLIFLTYQFLWAASALASEKTFDTAVSIVPGAAILISVFAVMSPYFEITNQVFWWGHLAVFCFAFGIDLIVGNGTGNTILTLKSVEQRTNE
jgi:hypothetical protein